jgi:hypothetical protein
MAYQQWGEGGQSFGILELGVPDPNKSLIFGCVPSCAVVYCRAFYHVVRKSLGRVGSGVLLVLEACIVVIVVTSVDNGNGVLRGCRVAVWYWLHVVVRM